MNDWAADYELPIDRDESLTAERIGGDDGLQVLLEDLAQGDLSGS